MIIDIVQILLVSGMALAGPSSDLSPSGQVSKRTSMNGFTLKSFTNFEKKWNLVTVRYRKDTQEMRFVYANNLAWKSQTQGSANYPDGAIFGKIGHKVEDDPEFTSSLVPSGARRFQFMIRDTKKFAKTGGWGYALFDSDGHVFEENEEVQSAACYACHQIVGQTRGFIFSRPLNDLKLGGQLNSESAKNSVGTFEFENLEIDKLPENIRKLLPPSEVMVRSLVGNLQTHVFQGTLDEVKPALIKELKLSHHPALFMEKNGSRFSFAYKDPDSQSCPKKSMYTIILISSQINNSAQQFQKFCDE